MTNLYVVARADVHISGSQVRLARGLVSWTQADLALNARVKIELVRRIEADEPVSALICRRIRSAFEMKKIAFPAAANPYIAT